MDCDAEVSEPEVAAFLKNDVLGLDVLVHDFAAVYVFECHQQAAYDKFYL